VLVLATAPPARLALAFTPAAYCGLAVLGLAVIASLVGVSLTTELIAAALGLMRATVGTDPVSCVPRSTFDASEWLDRIRAILVMHGPLAIIAPLAEQLGDGRKRRGEGTAHGLGSAGDLARDVGREPAEPGALVVWTCRSGDRTRSHAQHLMTCCPRSTSLLDGRIETGKQAGLPVMRDPRGLLELLRQVQIAVGTMILAGFLFAWLVSPWFLALPASPAPG